MSNRNAGGGTSRTPNVRELAREVTKSLSLRRELAQLEFGHDRLLLQRFAFIGALAASLIIVGVSLLLATAAWELAQITELSFSAWLALLGVACLVPGGWILWISVRTVRREFCGLRSTLTELREDLAWLRDWSGSDPVEPESDQA